MSTRVHVENVTWAIRRRTILSGVSLNVHKGEVVVLMGRNGAGKSTLLDIVAGLRLPTSGSVRLDDRPLGEWHPRDRAKAVAHLPQAVRSDLPFLASELVRMGRYPHTDRWFESEEDRLAVERAMRRTDCWHLRDRLAQTLSGGERQRVLLAACFAQSAPLLLLDEPATHLDVDQQLHCFSLLREESQRGGSCVVVTHDLNLALTYGTRIIVLADGRIALDAAVEDVGRNPDWLALFSPHLTLSTTPSGRPWVSYS